MGCVCRSSAALDADALFGEGATEFLPGGNAVEAVNGEAVGNGFRFFHLVGCQVVMVPAMEKATVIGFLEFFCDPIADFGGPRTEGDGHRHYCRPQITALRRSDSTR
jgi:hypothetical protein